LHGFFSDIVWAVSFTLELYLVGRAIATRDFLRYLSLNLFVAALALRDVGIFFVFRHYGYQSTQYAYAYYYSDALLTILMYLAIMHLYYRVFREMHVGRYIRALTVALLTGTALVSYLVVLNNANQFSGHFVNALSQNLYFVGLVLTYLLWAAVFKLRETRSRLVQLVLALGIYFSATAALYALRNMFPSLPVSGVLVPLLGLFLPAAWAYTFTRTPEDARLVPASLAEGLVSHR
jgi:hypothetical protein